MGYVGQADIRPHVIPSLTEPIELIEPIEPTLPQNSPPLANEANGTNGANKVALGLETLLVQIFKTPKFLKI